MHRSALRDFGAELHERRQIRDLGARLYGHSDTAADSHDEAKGPCIECAHATTRCGPEGLACQQFSVFIRYGGNERWRAAARQPSVALYMRIYGKPEPIATSGGLCVHLIKITGGLLI